MIFIKENWIKILSGFVIVIFVSGGTFVGYDKYLLHSAKKEQEKADLIAKQQATEELAQRQAEELIEKEKQTAELLAKQQDLIEDAKAKSSQEVEQLKSEVSTLRTQAEQQVQPQTQPESSLIDSLEADIVSSEKPSDWTPEDQAWGVMTSVAKVICFLRNGEMSYGSGSLWFANNEYYLLTNIHVLEEADRDDEYCGIAIPIDWNEVTDNPTLAYENDNLLLYLLDMDYTYWKQEGLDMAVAKITEDEQPLSLLEDWGVLETNEAECNETTAIGKKILIIGFPYTGATYIPTITEGVVSSYENIGDTRYYITSAKIEHGNSGGIAVTEDYYCTVGIPTSVNVGETESLGRILLLTEDMLKEYLDSIP